MLAGDSGRSTTAIGVDDAAALKNLGAAAAADLETSCAVTPPSPPDPFVANAVNVRVELDGCPFSVLEFASPYCTDGAGWAYDDLANPTLIVFCPKTCEHVRATATPSAAYGCATIVR